MLTFCSGGVQGIRESTKHFLLYASELGLRNLTAYDLSAMQNKGRS
jgi:hypothetical protein